ncbi:hypothetical protein MKX03_020580, partial [Papaver bracteatum]
MHANSEVISIILKDWIVVPSIGKSGGQVVAWNSQVLVDLVEVKFNIITMALKIRGISSFISCIYGALNIYNRNEQWDYLLSLNERFNDPWMLVGDMNFILDNTEKEGGNEDSTSMFNIVHTVIQQIGFIDLGFHGYPFTWSNHREGDENIRERIYMGLVNVKWFEVFSDTNVYHLSRIASDHNPLLIDISL